MIRRAAAVLVSAVLLLAGCGIPDNSDVVRIGAGQSPVTTTGGNPGAVHKTRADTFDRATFIDYYLQAAAGDLDSAMDRAKEFMAPATAAGFKPPPESIDVVRLTEEKPLVNQDQVSFRAQVVGSLNSAGMLNLSGRSDVKTYSFTVTEVAGEGLYLTRVEQVLMISDVALKDFYYQRPIYFWNTDRTALVPDLRYLPQSVPVEQAPTEILHWLFDGPQKWLEKAVLKLPENTGLVGSNVPAVADETLTVSLTVALDDDREAALNRLRRQIMWSLRPYLPKYLDLKIAGGGGNYSGVDYLTSNPAYRSESEPERLVLYDGRIRRLTASADATAPVPVLKEAANKDVERAAMLNTNLRTYAAVVTVAGGRRTLRVAGPPLNQQADLQPVQVPDPTGQPAWAVTPDEPPSGAVGLIPAGDGRLYSFTSVGGTARRMEWTGPPGRITAVAVAPDGRRVAVVAGGRLYLTVLVNTGDDVELAAQPSEVTTPMEGVTAVDWSSEGWLVIAGKRLDNKRVSIVDLSVDGGMQSPRLEDLGSDAVTYLAAFPASPTSPISPDTGYPLADSVAYVAGNRAYNAYSEGSRIGVTDLAVPVQNPPPSLVPTNPFFLR